MRKSVNLTAMAVVSATLAAQFATDTAAQAQPYPSRPITLIVPLAPGGSTDVIGRIAAEGIRAALGQPVVVENVPGAGGTIGVGRLARSAPDGYTIGVGQWGTNVANGAIYPLSYDLIADFEPVALISTQPFVIVGKKSIPANNLKELIAWLKDNSGKTTGATSGVGTPSHLGGILFQNAIGTKIQMVPYRSAGQSTQAIVAEQIDVMLNAPGLAASHIQAGTMKGYAVTSSSRIAISPNIPTVDEAGLPGFYLGFWHGIWAPKGTPKDIIDKLNAAINKTLADPDLRAKLVAQAQEFFPAGQSSPKALGDFQKAEIAKWWPIIKAADIKVQ